MTVSCCKDTCTKDGIVHVFTGPVIHLVRDEADYTGASYCCWEHLIEDAPRLPKSFPQWSEHGRQGGGSDNDG